MSHVVQTQKCYGQITVNAPEMKIVEFANSIDPDEVAHYEPPHLDLHCLSGSTLDKGSTLKRQNLLLLE